MTTKAATYDLTPEELEQKRLAIEQELIALKRAKTKAKWVTFWAIFRAVTYPVFVVFAFIFVILVGIIGGVIVQSTKKIL